MCHILSHKNVYFFVISATSVIGKLHGYVTFINLNFVLLSLSFVLQLSISFVKTSGKTHKKSLNAFQIYAHNTNVK